MAFQLIDLENWERREFYEHFIKEVVCTYSVVVNIDITSLKGQKLYPAMIWLLPLAIQVHHAVCDGYHIGVFVEKLQHYINAF